VKAVIEGARAEAAGSAAGRPEGCGKPPVPLSMEDKGRKQMDQPTSWCVDVAVAALKAARRRSTS